MGAPRAARRPSGARHHLAAASAALGLWLSAGCADQAPSRPATSAPRGALARPQDAATRAEPPASTPDRVGPAPTAAPAPAPRAPTPEELRTYAWLSPDARVRPLEEVFPAPPGLERVELDPRSFGAFLRRLPLRPAPAQVRAHDGALLLEPGDRRIAAVVELDVGRRDLQQCADTAIRLHAEWLWSRGAEDAIGYHFTSGDLATWARHRAGDRPVVEGPRVRWERRAPAASGREAFRAWLDLVFSYAGTVSLAQRSAEVARDAVRPGDVFVLPGGPGHAVVVLDLAVGPTGRAALLGQGFMPAQDAHVLRAATGSAWFDLGADAIQTPFWPAPFPWSALRRMRTADGRAE